MSGPLDLRESDNNTKTNHGILLRFIKLGESGEKESKSGIAQNIRPSSFRDHLWIRDISEIDILGLSSEFVETLRNFWHGRDSILYLESRELEPKLLSSKVARVIVERIGGRRSLIVFGAGHVGRSIGVMGVMLGLDVTLVDDRREFLEISSLPGCNVLLGDFNSIGKSLFLDSNTAVVIVTRGHQSDEVILRQVADHRVGYVGMIGSRRRVEGVFRRLRQAGVSDAFLSSVKAPIGLDISAQSPQEIAVSVHAEIIKHFSETVVPIT